MDEFAGKLKRDAGAIDGEVPAALRQRLDATLATTPRRPSAARPVPPLFSWASAAAGLAALAVVVVLVNRPDSEPATVAATVPAPGPELFLAQPLSLETVVLTAPLEQELLHLRADLDKARRKIEDDLRGSF